MHCVSIRDCINGTTCNEAKLLMAVYIGNLQFDVNVWTGLQLLQAGRKVCCTTMASRPLICSVFGKILRF